MDDRVPTEPWTPFPPADRGTEAWLAWANGHPVSAALGLVCTEVGADRVTCAVEASPFPNPNGSVHGGVLAAILDQALAYASLTAMRSDGLPNTASMQLQYLRPAMAPLTIRAWVTKGGAALVFTRAEIEDRSGRICTTGDATFAVLDAAHATARR